MNDNLRTRIAAVLGVELHGDVDSCDLCLGVADAVIRELALEQEWGCHTNNCRCSHRYVTEWKINDE
jgi:hypothetical protein